ncbi:MAG: putative zinc-binding metallopeptidase [Propionicimonas sp.]|nr:putative zinc-binding metallopeptidase [Propionicimonas sp.]
MKLLVCPTCAGLLFLESLRCEACGTEVAYHVPTAEMVAVTGRDIPVGERIWHPCSNRQWDCNWLVADETGTGRCFSCQLTRTRPAADDTIALEKLASTAQAKRRLLVQLKSLGLPVDPHFERDGGLGFDLISSFSENRQVMIGHANGIVTIDLAESLDEHRERLRIALGEPYRTMLGHFRHEVGHYYQWVLVEQTDRIDECRGLFGDERASYSDAIARHYATGSPDGWEASFISEYATMHPWEDFAECFAHYLHINETLNTAATAGLELALERQRVITLPQVVAPKERYGAGEFDALLEDWRWVSLFFNRANRAMGKADLYPFRITPAVAEKLRFIHRVLTDPPPSRVEESDGFRRQVRPE